MIFTENNMKKINKLLSRSVNFAAKTLQDKKFDKNEYESVCIFLK